MRRIDFLMAIEVAVSTTQKEVDYLWFGEYYFILLAPLLFSLHPLTHTYQLDESTWLSGAVDMAEWCGNAIFGFQTAFYYDVGWYFWYYVAVPSYSHWWECSNMLYWISGWEWVHLWVCGWGTRWSKIRIIGVRGADIVPIFRSKNQQ